MFVYVLSKLVLIWDFWATYKWPIRASRRQHTGLVSWCDTSNCRQTVVGHNACWTTESTLIAFIMSHPIHWFDPVADFHHGRLLMVQNHGPQLTLTATTQTHASYAGDRTKTMYYDDMMRW